MEKKSATLSPVLARQPGDTTTVADQLLPANLAVPNASAETNAGNGKYSIEWNARQIVLATLTALGVVFIFLLLYRFYMVVFIFFVAVTLQIGLRPAIAWLEKRGIRRDWALILVFVILTGVITGFIWLAVPVLIDQASTVIAQLPSYYTKLHEYLLNAKSGMLHNLGTSLPAQLSLSSVATASTISEGETVAVDTLTPAWEFVKSFSNGIFIAIIILMLAFYWTAEGDLITRRAILLAPQNRRDELRELLAEIETKVGAYFRGEAILCAIIAIAAIAAFFAIGVPYAFGLGLLMGFCEAIPTFGPSIGAIPVLLVTLSVDPTKAIWALGAIAIIQFLESHFIVPRVMDRSVGVNAVVTLLAIAGFGVLFGVGGAILAIPLAAILQILFNRLVLNQAISEETPTPTVVADNLDRNRFSVLRLEAQDLISDVRKQVRHEEETMPDPDTERAEDLLEAIVLDLDSLLTQKENAAEDEKQLANPTNSLPQVEGAL
ncbi:hypothetical protein BH10CHL1_BH10CHL1_38960 [soil metagenome]